MLLFGILLNKTTLNAIESKTEVFPLNIIYVLHLLFKVLAHDNVNDSLEKVPVVGQLLKILHIN